MMGWSGSVIVIAEFAISATMLGNWKLEFWYDGELRWEGRIDCESKNLKVKFNIPKTE